MSAEIINLADRRKPRIVRVLRRAEGFDPHGLVIPAAVLIGLAIWTAAIINVITLFSHARPPD